MKRFAGFFKKELIHILRDPRTLIILFGMPFVQILLFGYAITNEVKNARIAILDNSKDEVSFKLIDKILSSGYFTMSEYLQTSAEIDHAFKQGEVKLAVVIPERLSEKLKRNELVQIQLISDATDPNTGNTLINYTSAIIRDFEFSRSENLRPVLINPEIKMRYNPGLKSVYLFIPGIISVILMLVSTMMTSISLTREKELGTMEVLLASPMKPAQVIISKVIPYLFLAFGNALLILALGYIVFDVPVKGSLTLLLFESLLFIAVALSLGILISTKTDSQQVALMISLFALMLPTIILSGFIFPVENMPVILQIISNIIPAKWFIVIVKGIMLKGIGIAELWKETLILVGFIFVLIIASVKNYKVRLE